MGRLPVPWRWLITHLSQTSPCNIFLWGFQLVIVKGSICMDVTLSFVKQVFSHVSDQFSDPPRRTERGSISNISSPVLVALWKTGG